jgi:uncharacterized protein YkwD
MVKRLSPTARIVFVLLVILAVVIIWRAQLGIAQSEIQPEPVTSSMSGSLAEVPEPQSSVTPLEEPDLQLADGSVFMPFITVPERLVGYAQQVVNLTNQERLRAGCPPLTVSMQLVQAAQGHSEDMALRDFFSHTGSNGSSPADRINATGYQWRRWGENIAAGYSTPAAAVAGWMNSSGHRANILNCSFTEIGVGYYHLNPDRGSVNYRHYWTQVFASPR